MSYYCHDCGKIIEEDVDTLCSDCFRKLGPVPFTMFGKTKMVPRDIRAHLVQDAAHRLHDQNKVLEVFIRSYQEAIQNASQDDQLTLQNYMGYAAQEIKKVLGDDSD